MSIATSPRGQLIEMNVLFGLTLWNLQILLDLTIGAISLSVSAARVLGLS